MCVCKLLCSASVLQCVSVCVYGVRVQVAIVLLRICYLGAMLWAVCLLLIYARYHYIFNVTRVHTHTHTRADMHLFVGARYCYIRAAVHAL